jgi:hypothetical protein
MLWIIIEAADAHYNERREGAESKAKSRGPEDHGTEDTRQQH